MRRTAASLVVTALVAASALAGAAPALAAHRSAGTASTKYYYLSLGDSLSQGVQPNSQGVDVETRAGYPDQLFQALRPGNPLLHLVKLGCPGETTHTMIKGGLCSYPDGSQLAQAVRFLKAHQGHVQLVTIDIGANDLNPCVVLKTVAKIAACLSKVVPQTIKNLTTIMAALRGATATPVEIVGMNYYVPELAEWLIGTPAARQIAKAGVLLGKGFGEALAQVYAAFKAPTADVYDAFHTADFNHKVFVPAFGRIPRDVAYVCSLTWECTKFQNEHANRLGYGVIADAFLTILLG
jgi:lysophospholipase L1-like esterase